ncbi:hypothetical protein ACD661_05105 [Legionella lytica]|uniref:Uncharacterized protein n=1 Tax=Legionella lytica TaxID=96232 RepID=A0ABW8D5I0_9GAMM
MPKNKYNPQQNQANCPTKYTTRQHLAAAKLHDGLAIIHKLEFTPSSSLTLNPWMAALLLLVLVTPAAAARDKFPSEGSFSEKKQYIDSLTSRCTELASSVTATAFEKGPLLVQPADLPPNVGYKAARHTFFAEDGVATKRELEISKQAKPSDTTEIFIGSENNKGQGFLHKFKLQANGDLEPMGKVAQSLEEYSKDLTAVGAVVTEVSTDDNRRCYQYKINP